MKRPKFHFTPKKNWMNDPNGLIEYNGEFHLFFQYNPKNYFWGYMHWGHAISKNLFDWNEIELALTPGSDYDKDGCFSGSALEIDKEMVLFYTGVNYTKTEINEVGNEVPFEDNAMVSFQLAAKSKDGVKFKKIKEFVIKTPKNYTKAHTRDPKVWKENNIYKMVVGTKKDDKGYLLIWESKDALEWDLVEEITYPNLGYMWECPDIFSIENNKKALIFSPQGVGESPLKDIAVYCIKKGENFDFENVKLLDHGFDLYAPQTFKDSKERRIMFAWLRMDRPFEGYKWSGIMTIPREIRYKNGQFYFNPVEEIEIYRVPKKLNFLKTKSTLLDKHYDMNFKIDGSQKFELSILGGLKIKYSKESQRIIVNREDVVNKTGTLTEGLEVSSDIILKPEIQLRIIVDEMVVEIFIDKGINVISALCDPSKINQEAKLIDGEVRSLEYFELNK